MWLYAQHLHFISYNIELQPERRQKRNINPMFLHLLAAQPFMFNNAVSAFRNRGASFFGEVDTSAAARLANDETIHSLTTIKNSCTYKA